MTPVHVQEVSSQVERGGANAPATGAPASTQSWDELDRARQAAAELARLRARTSAEGSGD